MIDPTDITDFSLTHPELEERILFWLFAAGHNAVSTSRGVNRFLTEIYDMVPGPSRTPFAAVTSLPVSRWKKVLGRSGLGCWRLKSATLVEFVDPWPVIGKPLDLHTVTVDELERFRYVGPKTARCFLLHSRPDQRLAGLDTHIRKFMRSEGIPVPDGSLSKRRYLHYEQEWLRLCDEAGKPSHEFDLEVWNRYQVSQKSRPAA